MQNINIMVSDNEAQEIGESKEGVENTTDSSAPENTTGPKYTKGEPLTFIRVRFPGNAKSQPFLMGKRKFNYGQKVVALSDRGMTLGYINSFPYEVPFNDQLLPIKSISKMATDKDIQEQRGHLDSERNAEVLCRQLIEKMQLDMVLTHVEIMHFGKKAIFYFTAPSRVDFRELVKQLLSQLKMRIELRQISVRDRTAALGSVGPCGLQTCCSSFLQNYGNVTIKMAKNQNLALIPSKLNGACGQLKCCIKYEDEVYTEKRQILPKEGSFIKVKNKDIGKVLRIHVLKEQFEMLTDKGFIRKYARNQIFDNPEDSKPPKEWSFPERFDHISNETNTLIGDIEETNNKVDQSNNNNENPHKFLENFNEGAIQEDQPESVIIEDKIEAVVEDQNNTDEKKPFKKSNFHKKNRFKNKNNKNKKS